MKINYKIILFFLILLFGFIIRIYHVEINPVGFFCDEASIGYNAYTILTTGKDEYGRSFPIFFQSFGDYKNPIQIYSTVPFIALFGLTEFATRLPSVFYGIGIIILLYCIGKEMKGRTFGLWSSFIAATTPWLIHYNRVGFDYNCYAFFFLATIYSLLKAVKQKKYIVFFFAITGLNLYTYQPAKLIIPLFLLVVIIIYRKNFLQAKKNTAIGISIFLLLLIPLIMSFLNGEAVARFNQVSLLSSHLPINEIIKKSLANYSVQFTPNYLYVTGEPTFITRHFTNGLLPLLPITALFLFIGFLTIFIRIKWHFYQLLIVWLLLYPLSGALTADGPFTGRGFIGAPLAALLIALGIYLTVQFVSRFHNMLFSYAVTIFVVIALLVNTFLFAHYYFFEYPLHSSDFWGWQYGPREIIQYFVANEKKYDDLYMIGEFNAPYIFIKFYSPNDCKKCRIGVPDQNFIMGRRQLFAVTPLYLKEYKRFQFNIAKTIYYPNKTVAFLIGEVVQ